MWKGFKPGDVLLEELGRELTLKVEVPQLTHAICSCTGRIHHYPHPTVPLRGRPLSKNAWAKAQCQTPGNRSVLPLSSLGVAGTAHSVSSADREMEP